MKVFLAFVGLLVVGAQASKLATGNQLSSNAITKLLTKGLEYARTILEENDPISLPELGEQTITDDDVNLSITLSGVQLSNCSNFVINSLTTSLTDLTVDFELSFPNIKLAGSQKVNGTAFGDTVTGDGTFSADLTNFVQGGKVQFNVVDKSLQIETLTLEYSLESADFSMTGMEASSMTNAEIVEYLNNQLLTTLNDNNDFVCEKVANHVTGIVNSLMEGKSLLQVIKWLKSAVSS